ncbi:MAG: glutamine-hydrolyzing carbamoyl-phosphate synthase small subunit [Actinobacteria bacterium]|nr:glutamine-hydrolyzing carbamoyl-phosphate synthase small subunit [Actinomycetota bacterium]
MTVTPPAATSTAATSTAAAAGQGPFGSAVLVLEDGRVYPGRAFGARGIAFGEAVFATGMTGYQETLTDPSYRRQVVVATAPQIGNTGWVAGSDRSANDNESGRIQVAGFVVRDLSPRPTNWRATGSLESEMQRQGVVGISEVDTRGLTRHLRSAGVMRCGIFSAASGLPGGSPDGSSGGAPSGPDGLPDRDSMVRLVRESPQMLGADLAGEVSTPSAYLVPAVGEKRYTVAALDLGLKANTPQMLAARGIDCHVLPASASIGDIEALGVDGVFLSNGPGDPATADAQVALTEEVLRRRIPFFGICFGNQILGRALGLGTYKLTFGHRGINQPVREEATGRVLVTAHNHGFAVRAPLGGGGDRAPSGAGSDTAPAGAAVNEPFDTPFGRARVAFTCLNDGVVEGLECLDVPAFSVQFHPEAAAGPHDAGYLFDRFVARMAGPGAQRGDSTPAAQRGDWTPGAVSSGTQRELSAPAANSVIGGNHAEGTAR